jgi:hypothetical protein
VVGPTCTTSIRCSLKEKNGLSFAVEPWSMPILPFERARRNAVKHLETYLGLPGKNGRLKPISDKSALFRTMQKWENFFPDRCFPIPEFYVWLQLVDESRAGDKNVFVTANTLLSLMKGPYVDPTLPVKEGDPWCHIELEAKTVTIAGETFHIDHRPTLMILAKLARASKDKPVSSRNLRHIPGCGHARQVTRFLNNHLPAKIKKLIGRAPGVGGGRWLVPPE